MAATTEDSNSRSAAPTPENSAPTYILAVICLLLGIGVGYLLHSPKATVPGAMQAQQQAEPGAMAGGIPTPDQMNHMVEKATEPILTALQKDPNNADLLAQAGTVYFRAQQFENAAAYYEKALKIKPSPEGFIALSNAYHNTGADDRAIDSLNQALKLDPKSATALFNVGMLDWKVKNDPEAAIAAWQQLLKMNPKHPRRAEVEKMIAKAKKHQTMATTEKIAAPPL